MTTQLADLNTDTGGKLTSSEYGDRGDGTSKWYQWRRTADGGDATTGAKADAAVTDHTAAGSLVALLKGLLSAIKTLALGLPVTGTFVKASSGNVANAAATATMAAVVGKTNYLTGFEVTASGATAGLVVNVTVVGILGGTMTYTFAAPAGVLVAANPLIVQFANPIPASATNIAIVVSCPALGAGNTNAAVNAHGFYL